MILGFQGNLGSGKTLGASLFAFFLYFQSNKKLKIVSNYYLKYSEQLTNLKELYNTKNAIIVLDEIHTLIDSRLWKNNKKLLDFFLQLRKFNNFLLFTTQHFRQVDVRLRNITQYLFHCVKSNNYFKYFLIDTLERKLVKIIRIPKNDISFFYKFYNTFEFIESLKNKKEKQTDELIVY